ncbi:MAG: hypothetical protein H0W86_06485 [Armatimonadetes bacterium]|nr:hypothetical protein [Armatimonadota bacterium]
MKSLVARLLLLALFPFLIAGCVPEAPAPEAPAADIPVGFVNRVWKVKDSSAVEPGTLYVFLSDGSLIITSPKGKPDLRTWKYDGEVFTIVEESVPHKVDILDISSAEFRIRSKNPGEPVEILLTPAETPALPDTKK